ncbi:MAG: hypothetical protein ACREON_08680 [Gemmatimonadaceae bacterium]
MPHQYRIEKQRLAVSLRLLGGRCVEGEMFVPRTAEGYAPVARAIDVFNADEPFLPLELADGGVVLVAKDRVVEVMGEGVGEDDELRLSIALRSPLELILNGGAVLEGWMLLEVPDDRQRVLDFLNDYRQRFLTFYTLEGPRLVNARLIELSRPLD